MNWFQFFQHVRRARRDRSAMASVMLKTMDPTTRIGFDISGLRSLSESNRLLTYAFIDWHIVNPLHQLDPDQVDVLCRIVDAPMVEKR